MNLQYILKNTISAKCNKHRFCCSDAQSCPTLCDSMDCCMPDLRVPHHLPKFAQVRDHCIGDPSAIPPSDVLFSFCPKFFPALGTLPRSWLLASAAAAKLLQSCPTLCNSIDGSPQAPPSLRFSRQEHWSGCIRWPKYWRFSFNIIPSNEYLGLISLKIDWSDLLAVQRTFQSLLQHHRSNASILWHSAFFMTQFSQLYMTTGKTIVLTIQTFVSRVISLLSNTLCRFVMAFLPRSNHPLISRLESPSNSDFWTPKEEICPYYHISLSICHEVMGPDAMILGFFFFFFF